MIYRQFIRKRELNRNYENLKKSFQDILKESCKSFEQAYTAKDSTSKGRCRPDEHETGSQTPTEQSWKTEKWNCLSVDLAIF